MAKDRSLKINEYGVFRVKDGIEEYLAGRTEEEVYAVMGLPCFPPELREAQREFEWAAAGKLPTLLDVADIQGDLHMHTDATDGKATLAEMVAAAQARGLKYIAITDHSKRVTMARGLDGDRLRAKWAPIDAFNRTLDGFLVLKGVEVDILEKGGLDLDDDVLCGISGSWRASTMARMIARADYRPGLGGDCKSVCFGHCASNRPADQSPQTVRDRFASGVSSCCRTWQADGTQLDPARLDLDDIACAAAKNHGIPIVISTDAQHDGLGVLRYKICKLVRAGLTKADVANTRPWKELKAMLGRKR